MGKHRQSSSVAKNLIVGAIILSAISFTIYMGIIAFIQSSKALNDLSYVSGEVTDIGMIKHVVRHKYEPATIVDVLVLNIGGSKEKFGFMQQSYAFKQLLGFNTAGRQFEIYFDPEGGRIEGEVTLHIYDLTVGQAKIIDIKETNKRHKLTSIFFFALSLVLIVVALTGIMVGMNKTRQQRLKR